MELRRMKDINEIANFITNHNRHKEYHVGYIGTDKTEILDSLLNDFSDLSLEESFVCAYEKEKMIGLLGLAYDKEMKTAEIWGPFTNFKDGLNLSLEMWEFLLKQLTVIPEKFNGFYNIKNKLGISFMESLDAKRKADQAILAINKNQFQINNSDIIKIREISEKDYSFFHQLHSEIFKNTYFNADKILSRQSEENKVFIADKDGEFVGYVYSEANREFGEGDIHYLAVPSHARKSGIGKHLIQKSLDFLFSFNEISEITLCVEANNQPAILTYKKAGFVERYYLTLYSIEKG